MDGIIEIWVVVLFVSFVEHFSVFWFSAVVTIESSLANANARRDCPCESEKFFNSER